MSHFDVCNGDADGLCALHQLRLAFPQKSMLVTGVKRDISLLRRISAQKGDTVSVLDVSFDANRPDIVRLLSKGVLIDYFDHHTCTKLLSHPGLRAIIETDSSSCTAILVDRFLSGRYRLWTIVAAYGDNLDVSATALAKPLSLTSNQLSELKQLGFYLNYNSYGDTVEDLIINPTELYSRLHCYTDPFIFLYTESIVEKLHVSYTADMANAVHCVPYAESAFYGIFILPDAAWSRRIRGAYANKLANQFPRKAYAVLSPTVENAYTVSVRVPISGMTTADEFCLRYPTGGGRANAGGINYLDKNDLYKFIKAFQMQFQRLANH